MGYAGMAANVAGQAMQIAADIAANNAAAAGYRRRLAEQSGYRNQAISALTPMIAGSNAATASRQIARGSAERQAGYAQANAQPMATPTLASQVNASDIAQASLLGQQRGNMAGASDWRRDQEISRIRAQELLNNAINKAQGSANIAGIQQYGELHSKDALKKGGQFLSSMGSMASMMGGGGDAPSQGIPAFAGGNKPAMWSGYGEIPWGTTYDPQTRQNVAPSLYSQWGNPYGI